MLKMKVFEKIAMWTVRIKWVDDAVLLPSGVWGKSISWVKERHCIMVKDTIYQEDLTISNAYTLIAEF